MWAIRSNLNARKQNSDFLAHKSAFLAIGKTQLNIEASFSLARSWSVESGIFRHFLPFIGGKQARRNKPLVARKSKSFSLPSPQLSLTPPLSSIPLFYWKLLRVKYRFETSSTRPKLELFTIIFCCNLNFGFVIRACFWPELFYVWKQKLEIIFPCQL